MDDVIKHYNKLIEEDNDPFSDPEPIRQYMDKWDGQKFLNELQLSADKSVLEIGVGTGRLAVRIAPLCGSFVGIDVSPKTVERAKENLQKHINIALYLGDFLSYPFDSQFDIIYSSLTFMHIRDKQQAIDKVAELLKDDGIFVLSIDKNQSEYIDMGNRKLKIFPDSKNAIETYIKISRLDLQNQFDTEFAHIFTARKQMSRNLN